MRNLGRRAAWAAALAVTAATVTATVDAAPAGAAADGSTVAVCAREVYLRTYAAPDATYDGTLYRDDNVHVYSHAGKGMVHVHAYGDVHRDGYLLESALC